MSRPNREEKFIEKYETIEKYLTHWGGCVESHLLNKLQAFKPRITCRLKERESLYGKAFHRNLYNDSISSDIDKTIEKVLVEITDKIGVRIVVKNPEIAETVFQAIKVDTLWKANVTRIAEDTIYERPDTFIYTGYHAIVSPSGAGVYPSNLRPFITCEVQVRTQLQDAYADVSHDIVYKKVFRHDVEIRRLLARAMALLEVVDESFKSAYSMISDMDRNLPAYVDNLTRLYTKYVPSFREEEMDYKVLVQFISSLRPVSIEKIERFLGYRERDIMYGLKNRDRFLFKQPVILLLAYFASIDSDYLEETGLLSSEDMQSLYSRFNIATTII